MARSRFTVLVAIAAVLALLPVGCDNSSTGTGGEGLTPSGRTTDFTGCKAPMSLGSDVGYVADQACLQWEYDGESVLQLTHVNAVYNCCPDSVGGAITVTGQTITIDLAEWLTMPCDCICPFDVEYEIVQLTPGEYTVTVNEIYAPGGGAPFEFTVDLVASPSGEYCVDREIPQMDGGYQ